MPDAFVPQIVHALLAEAETEDLKLFVPGAFYPTLCGISWQYRDIGPSIRERFVCAACHQHQLEGLRDTLNQLITKHNVLTAAYASHLGKDHGEKP